jgi:MFS family permease
MNLKRAAAIIVTTALGATVGLVVGYFTSGYVGMSAGFYYWITYPIDSWHWPVLGALVSGLASLALHRRLPDKPQ